MSWLDTAEYAEAHPPFGGCVEHDVELGDPVLAGDADMIGEVPPAVHEAAQNPTASKRATAKRGMSQVWNVSGTRIGSLLATSPGLKSSTKATRIQYWFLAVLC
jgi:hypothetical protein